jgi:adenylylsulfate kinase
VPVSENITWQNPNITQDEREAYLNAKGCLIWLTGLSGSGKSTIARALEHKLIVGGHFSYVLDGDNIRHGLNVDLGFSPEDRKENIRRIAQVGRLFSESGVITISAFISPYRADRAEARSQVQKGRFIEVHIATTLEVCESRDPKGLYEKVRRGQIQNFTGVDAPYEEPLNPELRLETAGKDINSCVDEIISLLRLKGLVQES